MQIGVKQGDPVAPFLLLLIVKGLGGLMRAVVENYFVVGFRIGKPPVVVSHLPMQMIPS